MVGEEFLRTSPLDPLVWLRFIDDIFRRVDMTKWPLLRGGLDRLLGQDLEG